MREVDFKIVEKVVAYVTSGDRLLVFRHVHEPEAGIQVPAGTVEPGESPDDAVIREAHEETGLAGLTIRRYLGQPGLRRSDGAGPARRAPAVLLSSRVLGGGAVDLAALRGASERGD